MIESSANPPEVATLESINLCQGQRLRTHACRWTGEKHPVIALVVFVHDLQGHPQEAWKAPLQAKSNKSLFKQKRHKFFLPAELLSQAHKDVRVLTYNYGLKLSEAFTSTSKNGMYEHGNSLDTRVRQ